MKAFKIIFTSIVALAIVLLIAVSGIPANFLLNTIQSRFEAETGYRIRAAGGVSIRLLPSPAVSLRDVAVFDRGKTEAQSAFRAETLRIGVSFAGLHTGRPQVTDVAVHRPIVSVPLARERTVRPGASKAAAAPADQLAIRTVRITEGTIIFRDRDRVEGRLEQIDLEASRSSPDGPVTGKLSARWDDQILRLGLTVDATPARLEARMVPVEVTFEAPGLLDVPLAVTADVALRPSSININAVTGKSGSNSFNGWAVVDLAANKPMLKGDFDFSRLSLHLGEASTARPGGAPGASEPWSKREISLNGINFFDAQVKFSAAEFAIDTFKFAPVNVEARVNAGELRATVSQTEAYGGQVNGTVVVNASTTTPAHEMQIEMAGVNALTLLSDLADFDWLAGRMHAKVDVRAVGASQHAIMSSLGGTIDVRLDQAAIQGVDIARLIRNLTAGTLTGWQNDGTAKTDLAEVRGLFRISKGIASTDHLALTGPFVQVTGAGTVDLSAKTLNLRVAPRLVTGQGGRPEQVGLGVPVIVRGDWSQPSIHLDVPGILENPEAAYDQLRALGAGLFGGATKGGSAKGGGGNVIDDLIKGLGGLLNQPGKNR